MWNSTNCTSYLAEYPELNGNADDLLIVHIALCVSSALVSVVNIRVFISSTMITCSLNVLLLALEISSLVLATHYLPICVISYAYHQVFAKKETIFGVIYLVSLSWASVAFTEWVTFVIGAWRLVAIVQPLKANLVLTRRRASYIILFLFVVATASISIYLAVNLRIVQETETCYSIVLGEVSTDSYKTDEKNVYKTLRGVLWVGFVFFLIPTVCSISVTCCIVWNIRKIASTRKSLIETQVDTKGNSNRITIVLTVMLTTFLLCNATPYLSDLLMWYNEDLAIPFPWNWIFDEFLLCQFVNTLSFLGYYYMGTKFRENFWRIFRLRRRVVVSEPPSMEVYAL